MSGKTSFPKSRIKMLVLEGVHEEGIKRLASGGFPVDARKGALAEPELARSIPGIFVIGIRSNTNITRQVIDRANRLMAIGAFCIGTNQIDLNAAMQRGIPVFNAPFSNTRSVAELAIADIIMLMRRLPEKIIKTRSGEWDKNAAGCVEVRGKTLGIVGYGHIGSQVSVLAEALGMRVIYHDIVDVLSIGNAARAPGLKELLERSDAVTLHVPETPHTMGMIGDEQLAWMKPGSILINTSRGSVVDVEALARALASGRISGAAADVFPSEPKTAADRFVTPLQKFENVVLTPHIGGATLEAQRNIGLEVAQKLLRFINNGSTEGAVNFPNVVLPELEGAHRILHIHKNVPGVMQKINTIYGMAGVNIEAQFLRTMGEIGYLIMDTNRKATAETVAKLKQLPETIKVRAII